jgi:hypothetical protein
MNIQLEQIQDKIYFIRGHKVMLDSDLAILYDVETKRLNEQVKRNLDRFPDDFMFRLNDDEYDILRSQIATSSSDHGGRRYQPLVFTENGIAMLSTVLKSKTAIQVNISIMRIFTKLRSFHALEQRVDNKVNNLEKNVTEVFKVVFQRLDEIQEFDKVINKRKIGLRKNN